jgi:hypothetical protein
MTFNDKDIIKNKILMLLSHRMLNKRWCIPTKENSGITLWVKIRKITAKVY